MKEITLNVTGMVCSGCENRIQNALGDLEFVKNVVADHTKNIVIVTLDEVGMEGKIKEVIEDLGFEIVEDD